MNNKNERKQIDEIYHLQVMGYVVACRWTVAEEKKQQKNKNKQNDMKKGRQQFEVKGEWESSNEVYKWINIEWRIWRSYKDIKVFHGWFTFEYR